MSPATCLRRHVRWGAADVQGVIDRTDLFPGNTEIGHLGVALQVQQVLRLDVAVGQLFLAKKIEGLGRLAEVIQQFLSRNAGQSQIATLQAPILQTAVRQFHHNGEALFKCLKVVHLQEKRVAEFADLLQCFQLFLAESVLQRAKQAFDGDNDAAGCSGPIDLAKFPFADAFQDLIALDPGNTSGEGEDKAGTGDEEGGGVRGSAGGGNGDRASREVTDSGRMVPWSMLDDALSAGWRRTVPWSCGTSKGSSSNPATAGLPRITQRGLLSIDYGAARQTASAGGHARGGQPGNWLCPVKKVIGFDDITPQGTRSLKNFPLFCPIRRLPRWHR